MPTRGAGQCRYHEFTEEECVNGLPQGEGCMASLHTIKECGLEQDWQAIAPGEHQRIDAGVRWYNGLESVPCSKATVVVDYLCVPPDENSGWQKTGASQGAVHGMPPKLGTEETADENEAGGKEKFGSRPLDTEVGEKLVNRLGGRVEGTSNYKLAKMVSTDLEELGLTGPDRMDQYVGGVRMDQYVG